MIFGVRGLVDLPPDQLRSDQDVARRAELRLLVDLEGTAGPVPSWQR